MFLNVRSIHVWGSLPLQRRYKVALGNKRLSTVLKALYYRLLDEVYGDVAQTFELCAQYESLSKLETALAPSTTPATSTTQSQNNNLPADDQVTVPALSPYNMIPDPVPTMPSNNITNDVAHTNKAGNLPLGPFPNVSQTSDFPPPVG